MEANHILAAQANDRFHEEVTEGRLLLLNVGLADKSGTSAFWINTVNDEQSSFIPDWRPGVHADPVLVETVTLGQLIFEHGVPYYMKVDIEGNDIYCLEALTSI